MQRSTLVTLVGVALALGAVPVWLLWGRPAEERALPPLDGAQIAPLVAPGGLDDLVVDGWKIDSVRPGPGCEIRFLFVAADDGARAAVRLVEAEDAGFAVEVEGLEAGGQRPGPMREQALERSFRALVASNGAGAFFASVCATVVERDRSAFLEALWARLLLAGGVLFLLGVAVPRRRALAGGLVAAARVGLALVDRIRLERPAEVPRAAVLALFGFVLLTRAAAAWIYPLHGFELYPLFRDADPFQPPLHNAFVVAWSEIGGVFGLGVDLFWLRLPNVALALVLAAVLLRLGRTVGAPWAGFGAGALSALLPSTLLLGTMQEHYFPEMVAATWFLERLVWYVLHAGGAGRRAVDPGASSPSGGLVRRFRERIAPPGQRLLLVELVASAALSLWLGYMTALVIGPGALVLTAVALRRRDFGRLVVAVLLLSAALAPLVGRAWVGVTGYLEVSRTIAATDAVQAEVTERLHVPLDAASGVGQGTVAGFVPDVIAGLLGYASELVVALYVLAFALLVRRGVAWLFAGLLAVHAVASTRIFLSLSNTAAIWPLLLFLPAWAAASVRWKLRRIDVGWALLVGVSSALVVSSGLAYRDQVRANPIFEFADLTSIVERVQSDAEPHGPILFLDSSDRVQKLLYGFCRDAGTWEAFAKCVSPSRAGLFYEMAETPDWMVRSARVHRRTVLAYKEYGHGEGGGGITPSPLAPFLGRPPWTESPFHVVVDEDVPFPDRFHLGPVAERCEKLMESVGFRLYRCPPMPPGPSEGARDPS